VHLHGMLDKFRVTMGRAHERPVGRHPDWSCQLAFGPEKLCGVVGWLALKRSGLVVLVDPETGDAVKDHTQHATWLGMRPPDVSVLQKGRASRQC
jgi:aromatic ring-cleaving dioxygenase